MTQKLTIIKPDDMHLHLRDGEMLKAVLPFSAKQMARAVIMPNLKPPVVNVADALAYQQRILQALSPQEHFQPLMTLYLTDTTTPQMVREAKVAGIVAFKLYPAGATTNSDSGVTDLFKLMDTLEALAECGLPLLVHGEVTQADVDIFDREAVFIDQILLPLLTRLPALKVVFEHITTQEAVEYVQSAPANVAATVTPQHLLFNRNDMLVGGIRPHYYCLPVLKRAKHQRALLSAVTGKHAHRFFLGTDSAPHTQQTKENQCGCAGCFSAPVAIELYAQAFDSVNALDKLEAFSSINGALFYGLSLNKSHITLTKKEQIITAGLNEEGQSLIPLGAGMTLKWSVKSF